MSEGAPRRTVLVAFAGICLATLLAALDQTIVATALPSIVSDLRGFQDLSWVVTAYLLASTVTVPIYGKLGDVYGRRRMFVVAISVFLLGSVLCAVAQDMGMLIGARVVQGLGAGGLLPLAQTAIADLFSPRERGRYQGFISATWALAAVAGPLLGGTLTDAASWRWIFWLNLPLGALALLVVVRTMPGLYERSERRIDVRGAIVLSAAVSLVLLACSWGGTTYPWGSARVLAPAAAGLAGLVLFVWLETRVQEPLLPLGMFRQSIFTVASAASAVIGAILFAVTIYVPVYAQGALGATATGSGVVLVPLLLSWTVSSFVSGQIIARTGRYRIQPIVGQAVVIVGVVMLAGLGVDSSRTTTALTMLAIGFGMGLTVQSYIIATQNAAERSVMGTATAALQFFRSMGGSLAVAGLGALLAARLGSELTARLGADASRVDRSRLLQGGGAIPAGLEQGTRAALAAATHGVFLVLVPIAVVGLLLAVLLQERPLRTSAAGAAPAPAQEPEPGPAVGAPSGR